MAGLGFLPGNCPENLSPASRDNKAVYSDNQAIHRDNQAIHFLIFLTKPTTGTSLDIQSRILVR